LDHILQAPKDSGVVELIARRPARNEREILNEAALDLSAGLVGDAWISNWNDRVPDGTPDPNRQLTLMNSRVIALLAPEKERWCLAGDQLYVDFDLSAENLPAGTRLQIGTAIVEVSSPPHTGCDKFSARFGLDALKFVNGPARKQFRLRGINARVVESGVVRRADVVRKVIS